MTELSDEQKAIVALPLEPICVTACAGSGKTRTAVHRLHEMRRRLDDRHGLIALLSFSNVAVDTFRREYFALTRSQDADPRSARVEIDTIDGFITTNILRPHAHRTLGCKQTAFLVHGSEPFLKGFTVFDGTRPHPTASLRINFNGAAFEFEGGPSYAPVIFPATAAEAAVVKLGRVGAYTHSSGRYWAIRTLQQQAFVLRALARRYPHILIDEAQDIGPEHQALLEMLIQEGTRLSLIGDPHQGIYEFSGANGKFLEAYAVKDGVVPGSLTTNYRSVPHILAVANKLSGRKDSPDRSAPTCMSGAYYVPYKNGEKEKLISAFRSMLVSAEVDHRDAAIVCRSAKWAEQWRGGESTQGQGVVRGLIEATIFRDKLGRFQDAFQKTCTAVVGLLANEHGGLTSVITRGSPQSVATPLKRAIWSFVRDADSGLPDGKLLADTEWHPKLKTNMLALLARLNDEFSLKSANNLGQKLANKALLNQPIIQLPDLGACQPAAIEVSTVHQVKGESIDAVMYVADKGQIQELLDGTMTEVGRIGYVAVTRARNLFVLAAPESCVTELGPALEACGFQKPGTG